MKRIAMPNDVTVRQVSNADWPDVVDCWYGYEKGTNENATLSQGLLSSPGVYTCWGLWKDSQLLAVTWVSCQCSSYAHVLPIRSIYRADSPMHADAITNLWNQVADHYQKSGVIHFQALIADELHTEQVSLQKIGFVELAKIIRMSLHKASVLPKAISDDIKLIPVSANEQATFVEVLQQCFQNSLDVPELNVLNSSDSLKQQYEYPLVAKYFVKYREKFIGIIAVEIEQATAVLKYLGIIPESRGKGYATEAIMALISLLFNEKAYQHRSPTPFDTSNIIETIELRVDSRNAPARKLYQNAGFTEIETETMLLYPLLTSSKQQ